MCCEKKKNTHYFSSQLVCIQLYGEKHEKEQFHRKDPWLIYATTQEIFRYDMAHSKAFLLQKNLSSVKGLAVDYEGRRVFWTESGTSTQPAVFLSKADATLATKETVAMFGLKSPCGLAYDPMQENLYISDSALPAILVCRTTQAPPIRLSSRVSAAFSPAPNPASNEVSSSLGQGLDLGLDSFCMDVYDAKVVSSPTDLSLDHINGYLYWIDLGPRPQIVHGRADGTRFEYRGKQSRMRGSESEAPRALVATRLLRPSSLSLDLPTQTLFWLDSGLDVIESVGLDGGNRRVVHTTFNQRPSAVLVFEDRILWAIGRPPSIVQSDRTDMMDFQELLALEDDVNAMAILHSGLEKTNRSSNSCEAKTCTGLCLLGPGGLANCACPIPQDLNSRTESCAEINSGSSILYGAYKDEIIALSLSRYSSLSPLALRTQDMKDVYALAHLPLSGNLLFTSFEAAEGDAGKSTIYRLSRLSRNTGRVTSRVLVEDAGTVDSLAVDEVGRLIYWVDRQKESIEVASLDGQYRSRLVREDIRKPYAIALDPALG
ncbi:hypothetical protein RRG08_053401, partial [Elysia crispata]